MLYFVIVALIIVLIYGMDIVKEVKNIVRKGHFTNVQAKALLNRES